MKMYLLKITLFFAFVAFVDAGYGRVCDYLRDHPKGGQAAKVKYIIDDCHEDIIMMGSSRMARHYVPQVFEDSLGLTCYNAGIDGNGIILSYGMLIMILERYTPKIIIYDVSGFDMYTGDNSRFLDTMKPYYHDHKDCLADIFTDVNPMERWKMRSNLYRYSSKLPRLLGDYIHPLVEFEKGYRPNLKTMNDEPRVPSVKKLEVDSLKIKYLEYFVELARQHHIQLFFVASPTYSGKYMDHDNAPIRSLSKRMEVEFIDYYYDEGICSSSIYWEDVKHLNDKGARMFSKKIVCELKDTMR